MSMSPAAAPATRRPGAGVARRPLSRGRRETLWFLVFVSPWLIGFVGLALVPLLFGLAISFTNFDGLNLPTLRFVGFDNYLRAVHDPDVWFGLRRTLYFALVSVPLNLVVGLALAVALTQRVIGRSFFRSLFYLPSVLPLIAVVWVWRLMMNNDTGLVNTLLDLIAPGSYVPWMTDHPTLVLVVLSLWISTGGSMLIFLAGLQNVPKDLEDAARIDGANLFQAFRAVTLPLLSPVVFFQLVLGIIGSLQVLVEPVLLAGDTLVAVPPRPNYFYMVHAFGQFFTYQRFGYGSALVWLLFVLILLLTLLVFRGGRHWVYYETEQGKEPA